MNRSAPTTLNAAADQARAWLFDACFPFWANRGPDPAGGFYERLQLDGAPRPPEPSRVRVQARQTYVFAQAHVLGWNTGEAQTLIARGVEALLTRCRRPDGLFGRTIAPEGGPLLDDTADLYDNAFGLFGLAWAALALQREDVLDAARDVLSLIETHFTHPDEGYHDVLPPALPRRQNPHMHLFEALLALHAVTGEAAHLDKAARIAALFERRFFSQSEGRLREYFNDDLSPSEPASQAVIEPGHELEWCWLWGRFAARRGDPPPAIGARLYAAGCSALDARGLAPQSVHVDGAPMDASRRTWPQTEALKAHLAQREQGLSPDDTAIVRTFQAMFEDYLDPAPAGGWIDHYDGEGRPMVDSMTAATGYHIVCALAETMRVSDALSKATSSSAETTA